MARARRFLVTIVGKTYVNTVCESVFADSPESAVRAMLGTPDTLGRYAHRAYELVSVVEVGAS